MNRTLQTKKMMIIIPTLLIIFTVLFFIPFKHALVFKSQQNGNLLAYLPLKKADTFQIKYTHSIHLSSVIESYRITNTNQIKQYELMYEDFAIGMPANAEEGEIFEQKDGKYFIKNMKRKFLFFDLRTGKVRANHTVIYEDREYPLSKTIAPGTLVRIQTRKLSLFQLVKGVDILEF
jgi:hypothetical protein